MRCGIAYCIVDGKAMGRFMPTVFQPTRAETLPELARMLLKWSIERRQPNRIHLPDG